MSNYYLFIIFLVPFFILNYVFSKKNFLLDQIKSSDHKNFLSHSSVPLSGGILIFIAMVFFIKDLNYVEKFLLSLIFFLGLFSDIQKLNSPTIRLILQFLIILIILFQNEAYVIKTNLTYLDLLLEKNYTIKLLFTIFCLLVLINGTNFMDGVNGLCAGYYIVVIANVLIHSFYNNLPIEHHDLIVMLQFLLVFLSFNLISRSFLGDNGSYLISMYIGIYLIIWVNQLQNLISPYYICLLLWYPAFENLFSILRRKTVKNKLTTHADNKHLHHLLFQVLFKRVKYKKICNSLTGIIINALNFIFIFFGGYFINSSKILVFIIILMTSVYLFSYFILKKNV